MDVPCAFVQMAQQAIIEVDGPAPVGNCVEADVFTDERGGDGDVAAMQAHAAVVPGLIEYHSH